MSKLFLVLFLMLSVVNTASASLVVDFAIEDGDGGGDENEDQEANSMMSCGLAEAVYAKCVSGESKGDVCVLAQQVLETCDSLY